MNFSRTIILTLLTINAFGQIDFKADSSRNLNYAQLIGEPDFNLNDFSFRFWNEGEHIPGTFIELNLKKDNRWSYRVGHIDFINKNLVIKDSTKLRDSIDSLWMILEGTGILEIKNQKETIWTGTNETGEKITFKAKPDIYERRNLNLYTLEFITVDNYRQIAYFGPETIIKIFQQVHATSIDHDKMIQVISLLNSQFQIPELMRQQFIERFSKKSEADKRTTNKKKKK